MKLSNLISTNALAILIINVSIAQSVDVVMVDKDNDATENVTVKKKKQLNFFIIAKRQKGKVDLSTRYNVLRSKLEGIFMSNQFVSIIAKNANQASEKIQYRINHKNARIGTIWFDSHGKYIKGYSLFFIGRDEVSRKTLKDTTISSPFNRIAAFTDDETKLVIGSCYGGATYYRSSIDYKDTTRMDGDSLMFELGKIFTGSTIYGSESWVMGKPGLFHERGSVAGYPGRNLFHDVCYRPAWENMGKWNEYNSGTQKFTSVNPVTLDKYGNLKLRAWPYTGHDDVNKDITINLRKLKPGLYK